MSAQNRDCGYALEPPRRGDSNEYPQSIFSRNKKNDVYPCKPQFYYIKVEFKGSKLYGYKSQKGLPLETKNTQNHENRSMFS